MNEMLTSEQLEQQKQINEAFKVCIRRESLDTLKSRAENLKSDIQSYTESLKNTILRLKDTQIAIDAYDKQEPIDFYSKLKEVTLNEKIESFDVNVARQILIAVTKPLNMIASNGGRYRLGQMKIEFNVKTCKVRFYCVDDKERRRSYWGDKCHHPHVSTSGEGCLGNSAESIAYLSSEFEFGALFDIFIAYLESINLDDGAGMYAMNWDRIDAEGNIVHEGFRNLSSGMFRYGSTFLDDIRPDVTKCEHCGEYHNTSDLLTASDGRKICQHCASSLLRYCTTCKIWHYKENTTLRRGNTICNECLEKEEAEKPVPTPVTVEASGDICTSCGKMIEGDKYWNEEGNIVCKDCFEDGEEADDEADDEE